MSRESRIIELVKRYKEAEKKNKPHSIDPINCISRDIMRDTRKIFEKEIHEPIDNYL